MPRPATGSGCTINGVPYFDKPPLLYWLMARPFGSAGTTPFAARFWTALAAVGCASAVTARLGVVLGGPRLGLLAGLMVVANLGCSSTAASSRPKCRSSSA